MLNSFKDAIFYHIYPLGFCGAMEMNNINDPVIYRLNKIDDAWIDHIYHMGFNAIYFGPLFQSTYHGYDTIDYFNIDRRLGDNNTFKELVQKLHNKGIKVVVDGVFNHVGRNFWAFKDLQEKKQDSSFKNWFNIDFNGNSNYNDGFYYEGWEGNYDLVKLNLNNPDVKKHLFSAIEFWIKEFNIDGIRLDVAYCIDINFLKSLRTHCKSLKKDLWLMGEMIHGDYNYIANEDTLDSATNYECFKGIYSSHNDKNYFEIAYSLKRQFGDGGIYKNLYLYNFVDNHDVNRIYSNLKDKRHLKNVYALLMTMPGIPSVYYGSEWGIPGDRSKTDLELRPELSLEKEQNNVDAVNLENTIKNYIYIKRNCKALTYGYYKEILVRNEQFVYSRIYNNDFVIVALNLGDYEYESEFNVPINTENLFDLTNNNTKVLINSSKIKITLPPFSAKILSTLPIDKNLAEMPLEKEPLKKDKIEPITKPISEFDRGKLAAKQEIAIKLLNMNVSKETISKALDFSLEELENFLS
ncbi:alpha-amylase [Clostridium bornimense]|uniref:alpha-amylase family glycosyl hydrolase n=1 Tax=Clostridium bornimense TaxID=1216932 RepID=UPI001C115454|nr:alpha-amylase family glycosyl hydrolase [Clostridium bornimense]MBU5317155.1 alpha-amylase [Clostridium bornimense]